MSLSTIVHQADLCVIGGGLSGLCVAVSAARHGTRVVLMHERPMLGGNASSEVRMWVCGATGDNLRETGILEELEMENMYRNPYKNYSVWDSILYGKVMSEKNIILLLNCSCMDAEMEGNHILSVTGWQMTTQQFHQVKAAVFADCSGDSILAPLTGAPCREGREARHEYNESIAPQTADSRTMGNSCLLQAVETHEEHRFIPPVWAEKIDRSKLAFRQPDLSDVTENFWYLETGGNQNTVADAEKIREELIPLAYGMWDYLKNDPSQKEKNRNWQLSWVGMLPGKRESRRYIGAHVLTENEVREGGVFQDEIAYGGWPMDDHDPDGFRTSAPPNTNYPAPSPYGIPFGCLYSVAVPNLLFAGRNISVTHAAMSSTRVMATCCLLGQAVGTAAALCRAYNCLPGDIAPAHINELQQLLMEDDCYLPHCHRKTGAVSARASYSGDGCSFDALRDGTDRAVQGTSHAWQGKVGSKITMTMDAPADIHKIRLVFDSDLNRETLPENERILKRNMFHNTLLSNVPSHVPGTMVRAYRLKAILENGNQVMIAEERDHYLRLMNYCVALKKCRSLTLEILSSWGNDEVRIFSFEAN